MSLKNRNETKLLMENWRKVLEEGLYDNDPELLEEGMQEIGLTALAAIAALAPSVSQAKVSGQSEKKEKKAIIGLIKQAENIVQRVQEMNLTQLERQVESAKIENIMAVIAAIKADENRTLSPEQQEIFDKGEEKGESLIEAGKNRYFTAKKNVEAASAALSAIPEIKTLGTGAEFKVAKAKANLKEEVKELERAADYLKGLFGLPKSVQVKMSPKHKSLGLGFKPRIYSRTSK